MRTLLTLIILVILSVPVYSSPGECALDFLNIPVGAFGASLGQGGYARIEGAQAIFNNPAQIDGNSVFASYQDLLLDTRSQAAAAGISFANDYSLGVGIHFFSPGDINGYSADDTEMGNIRSGDFLVRLGMNKHGSYSYGLSVSLYGQRLYNTVGHGIGFGAGISRKFSFGKLSISADNIGPDFKMGTSGSPLPQRYSISGWIPVKSSYLDIVFDFSYRIESGIGASAGIEYSPVTGFFVRAGTNDNIPVSLGLGLRKGNMGFDYSYFPSSIFGDRHIFSFQISK